MSNMKCMSTNCVRPQAPAIGRGLCLICYSKAKKMVEAGTTTWEEIVALGLALPSEAEANPFTKWPKVPDTLVASHLLATNHPHDLTSLCIEYLGVDIEHFEIPAAQLFHEAKKRRKDADGSS